MSSSDHDQTKQMDYVSYLLRLWRESGQKATWRASLEDPVTGERLGFASVDELFDFLQKCMEDGEEMTSKAGGAEEGCAPISETHRKEKWR